MNKNMDPIELLMAEHRRIEQLLDALEGYVQRIDEGEAEPAELATFGRVLREMDEHWHQPKEERLLIPAMAEQGVSSSDGIIAAILGEHEEGRGLVRELTQLTECRDCHRIAQAACAFTDHARCHIYSEETALFPLARSVLSANKVRLLSVSFDALDGHRTGNREWELIEKASNHLVKRYGVETLCIDPRVSWAGSED